MSTNDSMAENQQAGGRCVIGVHLAIDSLRVVEVSRGHVANWANMAYPAGMQLTSKEFPAFLKSSLEGFHSPFRRSALWVVGPTPSLQVRFLSLPKARPRQMANLVYWTFRKEIPFDAAQTIFDYDVEGDLAQAGQSKKIDVTAYTVAQADVDVLLDVFARAGQHVDGVVIPSFALRNLLRNHAPSHAGPVLGLFAGEDSSALLFYKGKHVVSHRVFKTGMNVMLDVLRDRHPDWSPAKAYQVVSEALAAPAYAEELPAEQGGNEDIRGIRETVHAALGRLIQQVERSMSAYLVGKNEEEIKTLYVAGSLVGMPTLVKEMGAKLGLASQPLNLFQGTMLEGAVSPPRPEEGGLMAMALGAALSDAAHTPNLLHTYVKRMQEMRATRIRMAGAVLGVAGLALLIAAGTLVGQLNRHLNQELKLYQGQIRQFQPAPDRAMIQAMMDRAVADSQQLKNMATRSLPVAALNRLAFLTPEDVRLTALTLDRAASGSGKEPAARARKAGAAADAAPPEILLHMEGMVRGPTGTQESKLAAYMLRLENSGMFKQVVLERSEAGREDGDQVLLFGLAMKMDDLVPAPAAPPEVLAQKGAKP